MATQSEVRHLDGAGVESLNSFPPSHSVSVNCLEAMRAQSPPRTETEGVLADRARVDSVRAAYRAWQAEHPSALESFGALKELANGKKVAVFLDYDGTLSPIVEDPNRAFMSEAMRAAVKKVALHFPTAIISGRAREKVYEFVQLAELYYAGSHGMDIMGPATGCSGAVTTHAPNGTASSGVDERGNDVLFFQPASEFYPVMNEVYERLKRETRGVAGALVENNKFCITVHFRRVSEQDWEKLAHLVAGVLKDYPRLHTTHGRKVLEVRPAVDWDKGKALLYLLQTLGLEQGEDALPLYIGDDRTDEDAFTVLRERNMGCGILVSTVAKTTRASYSLRSPSEVMAFLHKLVEWREELLKHHVDS